MAYSVNSRFHIALVTPSWIRSLPDHCLITDWFRIKRNLDENAQDNWHMYFSPEKDPQTTARTFQGQVQNVKRPLKFGKITKQNTCFDWSKFNFYWLDESQGFIKARMFDHKRNRKKKLLKNKLREMVCADQVPLFFHDHETRDEMFSDRAQYVREHIFKKILRSLNAT